MPPDIKNYLISLSRFDFKAKQFQCIKIAHCGDTEFNRALTARSEVRIRNISNLRRSRFIDEYITEHSATLFPALLDLIPMQVKVYL